MSRKVERGKHTTRASMLLPLAGGGFVVDTPGFSLMETELMDPSELKAAYPEFNGMDDFCRFGADCLHAGEPGCAAAQALAPGRARSGIGRFLTRRANAGREDTDFFEEVSYFMNVLIIAGGPDPARN